MTTKASMSRGPEFYQEIARRYVGGESRESIARDHGCCIPTIRNWLIRAGAPTSLHENARTHSLNEAVFDNAAESEEAAYWVGFLMADGCVRHPRRDKVICLVLKWSDRGHIERLRAFLGSTHPIIPRNAGPRGYGSGKGNPNAGAGAYFSVNSHRLADALAKYGVLPRKSLTAKVSGLEENRHFWRGVIDGDGGVYESARASGRIRPSVYLCGSLELLWQFADFVQKSVGGSLPGVTGLGTIWQCSVQDRRAVAFIHQVYGDCEVALPRKWEVANRLMFWQPAPDKRTKKFRTRPLSTYSFHPDFCG